MGVNGSSKEKSLNVKRKVNGKRKKKEDYGDWGKCKDRPSQ